MEFVLVLGIGLTLLATCLITTVTSQNDSKISAITTSIKETIDKSLEEGRRENEKEVLFVMLASFILMAKIQEYIYKSNNELINNINNGASNMTTSGTSAIINNTQNIVNEALRENNTVNNFVADQGAAGNTIIDFPTAKQEGPLVLPFPAQVVDKGPNITVFPEYTSEVPTILDTPATVKEEPYVEVFPREEPKSMEDMILWSEGGNKTKGVSNHKVQELIGHDFEDYLTKKIGGEGSFSKGGRDFDGGVGNRWWEAKSGGYWDLIMNNPKKLELFKSSMGDRLRIAKDNGATYELISNSPIPEEIKAWLTKKGIPYTEILE